MRRTSKSAPRSPGLDALAELAHGIDAPFSCSGSLVPAQPLTLALKDGSRVRILRAEEEPTHRTSEDGVLAPLLRQGEPARFGHGRETRFDPQVRDALQLSAADGGFTVEGFEPSSSGVLAEIGRVLGGGPDGLEAELHAVNVYSDGGHFLKHKDTPLGNEAIGTLVVCLPSRFSGGQLQFSHRGARRVFDWARAIEAQAEPSRLHWAAFFGDVDHAVAKVWRGHRVTVTWNLRRKSARASVPPPERSSRFRQTLASLLEDRKFLPGGGTLGFPCVHLYSHPTERVSGFEVALGHLKGKDADIAAAARSAGLWISVVPYLIEDSADEKWQLARFPSGKDADRLRRQVAPSDIEKILTVTAHSDPWEGDADFGVTWVIPPPEFSGPFKPVLGGKEEDVPALALFRKAEYSATSYFGNESCDVAFYVYAALHVAIPPLGEGPRQVAKGARKAKPRVR